MSRNSNPRNRATLNNGPHKTGITRAPLGQTTLEKKQKGAPALEIEITISKPIVRSLSHPKATQATKLRSRSHAKWDHYPKGQRQTAPSFLPPQTSSWLERLHLGNLTNISTCCNRKLKHYTGQILQAAQHARC